MTKRKRSQQKFGNQTYKSVIDQEEIEDHFEEIEARRCLECGEVVEWDEELDMASHLEDYHGITIREEDEDE